MFEQNALVHVLYKQCSFLDKWLTVDFFCRWMRERGVSLTMRRAFGVLGAIANSSRRMISLKSTEGINCVLKYLLFISIILNHIKGVLTVKTGL